MTTTNLAEFGFLELQMSAKLLTEYSRGNFSCPYFISKGVHLVLNKNSGYVFLSDEDYNILMMNDNQLEGFYVSPYSGYEGFIYELIEQYDDEEWHSEDIEWFKELLINSNKEELLKQLL